MGLFDQEGGNYLSQLLTSTGSMTPGFMTPAPSYNSAPQGNPYQPRSSVVNVLGSLFDDAAELGGETGGYQPRLDAAWDRQRTAESDQMARDEFGLKRQKYGLDLENARFEQLQAANKVLGNASGAFRHVLSTVGPQAVQTLWGKVGPLSGLPPELRQQLDALAQSDPEGFVGTMEALAKAGSDGTEAGLNLVYGEDENGDTVAYQPLKGGGLQRVDPGPGVRLTPGVQVVDYGDRKVIIGNKGGRTLSSSPVVGGPEKGEIPVLNDAGDVVAYRLAPGSKNQREATNAVDETTAKYDAALAGLGPIDTYINDLDAALEALKDADSMTGVDGQTWIGNLRALGYENIPGIERVFNSTGGSARATVDSITTNLATNFMNTMRKATDEGASSSARMQDTEKEVQRLKESVTNAKDYNSAKDALNRFVNYVQNQRAYLMEQRQKQAAKRAEITGGPRQQSFSDGNIPSITDDAGYEALPSGATFRAPDGSIRRKP